MNYRTAQWMAEVEQSLDYKAQGPLFDIAVKMVLAMGMGIEVSIK